MGVLTDILIADADDAAAICAHGRHWEHWPCLQFKGLGPDNLAELLVAMGGHDIDTAMDLCCSDMLHRKGEAVLLRLPTVLRDRLSELAGADVPALAERWVAQEDMVYVKAKSSDVEPVLQQMHAFAFQAVAAGKPLLLWVSP